MRYQNKYVILQPEKTIKNMFQTTSNITPKYSQETHYNYVKNSGFMALDCSPLLYYRSVTTTLTAQIPTETLSQTHRVCFIGKERDSETGFSYFGARYYDSDVLTGWLSVDPMADKYPSYSPYQYCRWNPMKLVDPNGKKDKPFRFLIDKYVSIISGTETPIEYKGEFTLISKMHTIAIPMHGMILKEIKILEIDLVIRIFQLRMVFH